LNWAAARVRIAFEIGVLAVLVQSGAAACGGSSAKVAKTNGLVIFSRSGEIYVIRTERQQAAEADT
jgi:hypothetical protein